MKNHKRRRKQGKILFAISLCVFTAVVIFILYQYSYKSPEEVAKESEPKLSGPMICEKAEKDSICDGLDVAYGEGFQATCCSEEGKCC